MTNVVTITVYPQLQAGTISGDQTLCYDATAAILTGTAPTGGDGSYSYQWQSSANGQTFSDIPGATDLNYSPGVMTQTMYYWLLQTSGSGCGMVTTNFVTITVNTAPSFSGCPGDISQGTDPDMCTAAVNYTVTATGTPPLEVIYSFTGATTASGTGTGSGSAFNKGVTTVTITAINGCSPDATCSFTVTVNDNQPPTALCKPATVYLDATGQASITASDVNNGSSDNCGITSMSVWPDTFTCSNEGSNTVVLTVGDAAGNSSTCTTTVTVIDNTAPSITCPYTGNTDRNDDQGYCTYAAEGTEFDATATDNCGAPSLTYVLTGATSGTARGTSLSAVAFNNGITTVTWTAEDAAGNSDVCSYTVTVSDTQPPVITCPADQLNAGVNSGCMAVISVGTATATDNCGISTIIGTRSDALALTAPYPIGTTTINWVATDIHSNTSSCVQTVTVVKNTLDGYLKYYNSVQTVMNNVTLSLNPGGLTSTTDATGHYSFPDLCAGTYTVAVTNINKTAGGINSTDAAQVNTWGVTPYPVEKIRAFAGDVIEPGDNQLNSSDAGRILQYFVTAGIPSWPQRGLWTFWPSGDMINTNPLIPSYPETITIPVSGASVTQDIYSLCTGDFNGSFLPGSAKEGSNTLTLTYGATLQVKAGDEFDLPLYSESAIDVGAISLIMNFPSEKLEIMGVTLADQASTPMMYNVSGEEFRIGWYSRENLSLKAGDKLLTLKVKLLSSLDQNETIHLTLATDELNELADAMGTVIPDAVLNIDLIGSTLGINPGSGTGSVSFTNYPNPFTGATTLAYNLPENGYVTIELRNELGVLDKIILNNIVQTAGDHKLVLDASDLSDGVYFATLKLMSAETVMTRTIKIVRTY
jgi:hypothetical protein